MSADDRDDELLRALLAEAEASESDDLALFLRDMRAMAERPAPAPNAELAEVLGHNVTSLDVRRARRRGVLLIAVGVVAATTLGAGAAAATSPDFRQSTSSVFGQVVRVLTPAVDQPQHGGTTAVPGSPSHSSHPHPGGLFTSSGEPTPSPTPTRGHHDSGRQGLGRNGLPTAVPTSTPTSPGESASHACQAGDHTGCP